MSDLFSPKEDELNIILNKLSKTISTFSTLSREQAENAIIETNTKIKEGEIIINKMESLIKEKGNDEEVLEHSKRINNIKTEFKNIVNKFNSIQKSYINRKAQTALIEDVQVSINQKRIDNLIDDENEEKEKEKKKDTNSVSNNANTIVFEKNIGNISENSNNQNSTGISDEVINHMNIKNGKKKKKYIILLIFLFFIVICAIILFLILINRDKNVS